MTGLEVVVPRTIYVVRSDAYHSPDLLSQHSNKVRQAEARLALLGAPDGFFFNRLSAHVSSQIAQGAGCRPAIPPRWTIHELEVWPLSGPFPEYIAYRKWAVTKQLLGARAD
jgi:hypothetical protein